MSARHRHHHSRAAAPRAPTPAQGFGGPLSPYHTGMEYYHAAPFTVSEFQQPHYHQQTAQRYSYNPTAYHCAASYPRTAARYVDDRSGPYTGLDFSDFYPATPQLGNYVSPVFTNMGAAAAAAGTATGAYSAFRYLTKS